MHSLRERQFRERVSTHVAGQAELAGGIFAGADDGARERDRAAEHATDRHPCEAGSDQLRLEAFVIV